MQNKNIQKALYFLILFFNTLMVAKNSVMINVFVHGTYPAKKILTASMSPVRYLIHAPEGLHLVKKLPCNYAFCRNAAMSCALDFVNYPFDHYYAWGWNSSNVRPENRCNEGKKLYESCNQLLQKYVQEYEHVTVRLIGSSHGGNVILNMLSSLPFAVCPENIQLQVVLLGTPVQEHTRHLINNPYVSKAYSFYSTADWIQRIDAQKFHKIAPKGLAFGQIVPF